MALNPSSAEPATPAATPEAAATVRSLPFAFAKRHGVLIRDSHHGVVHAIYPTLVRLRPHFFARYLFVRAEKLVHVAAHGAAPAHPAAPSAPATTQAKVA